MVIDPRRDVDEYVKDAEADGLKIELIIETHFHADFLSGHLELAAATGAEIGFSSVAETEFPSRKLADGEKISLGEVELEILHTPGHTPESISIVVWEKAGDDVPYGVLTGDTLFIGDVGRPDLLGAAGHRPEDMAGRLYRSLREKLPPVPTDPSMLELHARLAVRSPSSTSDAVPVKLTVSPRLYVDASAGAVIVTAGGPLTTIVI